MAIDPIVVLIWLVVGVIAGWLSSRIVTGGGLGPIWDLTVGIVGAVIAGYTLPLLGFYTGGDLIAAMVNAVVGAVVFLRPEMANGSLFTSLEPAVAIPHEHNGVAEVLLERDFA